MCQQKVNVCGACLPPSAVRAPPARGCERRPSPRKRSGAGAVSADERQSVDLQRDALIAAGVDERHGGSDGPVAWLDGSRSATPLALHSHLSKVDRFELFYWSAVRGRWRTFGDVGRLPGGIARRYA